MKVKFDANKFLLDDAYISENSTYKILHIILRDKVNRESPKFPYIMI